MDASDRTHDAAASLLSDADARRQAARVEAIARAQHELAVSDADERQLTARIAEMAQRLLAADGGAFQVLEDGALRVRSVCGIALGQVGVIVPLEGSLSGLAATSQRTQRCDDVDTDPRVCHAPPHPPWKSIMSAPLRQGDKTVGVISVMSLERAWFTQADETALELLAESLGAVLQRRRHADELAASESQYRSLFVDNPQPMCVYDPATLRFLAVNAAALAQYGYTEAEALELTIEVLRSPQDMEAWRDELRAQPLRGQSQRRQRHRRKNGEVIHVESYANDILFQGRTARLVVAVDVTERENAQTEIARLNAELEERVRLRTAQLETANAELQAFSYSIAHDLRSPLTSIDGFSQTLDELCTPALGERGRHYLRRIRAGVRQMSDLTDAMLSLAQLSRVRLKWESVDLAEAAREAFAQLQEAEPKREATLDAPPHLHAHGDPRLLIQVVANLVGNAWKFSGKKPRTAIRFGCNHSDDCETVFFVADEGAGFDMAYAAKLFGAFQRLHSPSEFDGTGIGLALVQKIVARHGGRIWAQATPGQGATFYFTLAKEPVA